MPEATPWLLGRADLFRAVVIDVSRNASSVGWAVPSPGTQCLEGNVSFERESDAWAGEGDSRARMHSQMSTPRLFGSQTPH